MAVQKHFTRLKRRRSISIGVKGELLHKLQILQFIFAGQIVPLPASCLQTELNQPPLECATAV